MAAAAVPIGRVVASKVVPNIIKGQMASYLTGNNNEQTKNNQIQKQLLKTQKASLKKQDETLRKLKELTKKYIPPPYLLPHKTPIDLPQYPTPKDIHFANETILSSTNKILNLPEYYSFPSANKTNRQTVTKGHIYTYDKQTVIDITQDPNEPLIKGDNIILSGDESNSSCSYLFIITPQIVLLASLQFELIYIPRKDEPPIQEDTIKHFNKIQSFITTNTITSMYYMPGLYCNPTDTKYMDDCYKISKLLCTFITKQKLSQIFFLVNETFKRNLVPAIDFNSETTANQPYLYHKEALDDTEEYETYITYERKEIEKQAKNIAKTTEERELRIEEETKERDKALEDKIDAKFDDTNENITTSKKRIIKEINDGRKKTIGTLGEDIEIKYETTIEKLDENNGELNEKMEDIKEELNTMRETLNDIKEKKTNQDQEGGHSKYYKKYKKYKSKYLMLKY